MLKFNLECEPHRQKCGTGERAGRIEKAGRIGRRVGQVGQERQVGRVGQVRRVGQVGQVGELFGYRSVILRSSFALPVSLV